MDREKVIHIARRIFEANRARERFRPLRGEDAPESLEAAYRIQDEVHRLFETEAGMGPPGGHKIALTSRAVQELCGVDQPVYGRVFAKTIRQSPARVRLSDYLRLGLEFEVAVEIGRDLPASAAPWTRARIADYEAAVLPAFELIEDRDADYDDLDAASILADRCWCAGMVLGPRVEDWQALDLAAAPVELCWNDEAVERAVTGDSLGHPFEGLAWVANHLVGRGQRLREGEVVITGSALKTRFRNGTVQDLARQVLSLSEAGLVRRARFDWTGKDETHFLAPLIEFAESGITPAESKLVLYEGAWQGRVEPLFRDFAY